MAPPLKKTLLPPTMMAVFALKIIAIIVIALLSYQSLQQRSEAAQKLMQALSASADLSALLAFFTDAETGQRGFLLTGDEAYLAPYIHAQAEIPPALTLLGNREELSEAERGDIEVLRSLTTQKLAELTETIALRRAGEIAQSQRVVESQRGKELMDRIRAVIGHLQMQQEQRLQDYQLRWESRAALTTQIMGVGCLLLLLLALLTVAVISRDHRAKQLQAWLRNGQVQLTTCIQGEQTLAVLGQRVLEFLAVYLGMPVGVIYTVGSRSDFQYCAAYALEGNAEQMANRSAQGLLIQAVQARRTIRLGEVPANYLPVSSALGKADAHHVLIAPAIVDGEVQAVLELGFLREISAEDEMLLQQVAETLGIALRGARDRSKLEALLSETQSQAEELQMQQEELRVSNEELEEQSHALKQSQAQLESQQAELEQINASLEEHMQLLADQKSKLELSQKILVTKADELERVNQYKSEFLANMSHELRTPLNSSLIFAKLLAENKERNLSSEQVKYAETIWSAGNDLLTLINDILDLSKIEAGKVEIVIDKVSVPRLAHDLATSFVPLAKQRGLTMTLSIADDVSEHMHTDAQRLGQILKNLLSNALKFTEAGEISLRVARGVDDTVMFAVADTGIGIQESQQEIIFEAFRQADGSTHRKYGGTGLGLSISRHLAHVLGGNLSVSSVEGAGSVFTLTLPLQPTAERELSPAPIPTKRSRETTFDHHRAELGSSEAKAVETAALAMPTDRRVLLIVEDDTAFAEILAGMARDAGFRDAIVHTAAAGLAFAREHRPSAILLDMQLPDGHGLDVLDELKRDPSTRHIPVHIISVDDYRHEALGRGAIGYLLKPAQREQLLEVLQRFEEKLEQRMRRVLVVEDDARQLESIRHLLSTGDVEITGVSTGYAALEQLQSKTFDCVVMDLKLPDLSGFDLLERMAECEDFAFPPVIVYTGRLLSSEEEQQLRRFSKSIIIKDARSPERLLDEVTLFLHQVEAALPLNHQRMLKRARNREAAFEGRRILVVEDDARNIFALTSILEPRGAKVDIARNGREALAMLAASQTTGMHFDAVLMDIMMPEMDGYAAMREIRKMPHWQKLPIIALTAKAMRDDQEKCLEAGANDYIAKPLDVDKLLSLLRVWMPK